MHGKTLYSISLGVSPFYMELQEIFMDDHSQVTIVVQNLIFYNILPIIHSLYHISHNRYTKKYLIF